MGVVEGKVLDEEGVKCMVFSAGGLDELGEAEGFWARH